VLVNFPKPSSANSTLVGERVFSLKRVRKIPYGLVATAIGYRSAPVADAVFDDVRMIVPNTGGLVDDRLFTVGWIGRGPSGVIRHEQARCLQRGFADCRCRARTRGACGPGGARKGLARSRYEMGIAGELAQKRFSRAAVRNCTDEISLMWAKCSRPPLWTSPELFGRRHDRRKSRPDDSHRRRICSSERASLRRRSVEAVVLALLQYERSDFLFSTTPALSRCGRRGSSSGRDWPI
jgi:hypothetical protein